jgi:hypothetical protein
MARIKYNEEQEPLKKKHYGFTFIKSAFGQSMLTAQRNRTPRTSRQLSKMQINQKCVRFWRTMPSSVKVIWESFATAYPQSSKRVTGRPLTGYQLFVKRNYYHFLVNGLQADFITSPVLSSIAPNPVTFSINSGTNSTDITAAYISAFGLLPSPSQLLFFRVVSFATLSGQFFPEINQPLLVTALQAGKLIISINLPASPADITYCIFVSKPISPGRVFFTSQCRYMGFLGIPPQPLVTNVYYGLLYNSFVISDSHRLTSSEFWIVPTQLQTESLIASMGGNSIAGLHAKDSNTAFWLSGSGTNIFGYNARGSGMRQRTGIYGNFREYYYVWSSTIPFPNYNRNFVIQTGNSFNAQFNLFRNGMSIRLLYAGTGEPAEYSGNDGKKYRTIKIGNQIWLADNLCETRFRDGSIIPWFGANQANYFTNAEWAALTGAGVCAYNNLVSNVSENFQFPT